MLKEFQASKGKGCHTDTYRGRVDPSTPFSSNAFTYCGSSTQLTSHSMVSSIVQLCTVMRRTPIVKLVKSQPMWRKNARGNCMTASHYDGQFYKISSVTAVILICKLTTLWHWHQSSLFLKVIWHTFFWTETGKQKVNRQPCIPASQNCNVFHQRVRIAITMHCECTVP